MKNALIILLGLIFGQVLKCNTKNEVIKNEVTKLTISNSMVCTDTSYIRNVNGEYKKMTVLQFSVYNPTNQIYSVNLMKNLINPNTIKFINKDKGIYLIKYNSSSIDSVDILLPHQYKIYKTKILADSEADSVILFFSFYKNKGKISTDFQDILVKEKLYNVQNCN